MRTLQRRARRRRRRRPRKGEGQVLFGDCPPFKQVGKSGKTGSEPRLAKAPRAALDGVEGLGGCPPKGGDDAKETWHCRLALEGSLVVKDGVRFSVSALVDTGSEVNLVRKGLVDPKYLRPCGPEVSFVAVNKQGLGGNHNHLSCELSFQGCERDTKEKTTVVFPFRCFDASIDVGAILSYEWLARQAVTVWPRQHGVTVEGAGNSVWVPGVKAGAEARKVNEVCRVRRQEEAEKPEEEENYVVRREYFEEFTRRLNLKPVRDCVASDAETQCEKFFNLEEDALQQRWDPTEVLWLNHPWSLWPQVAAKLLGSTCTAVCVLPAWRKQWVRDLVHTATRRL